MEHCDPDVLALRALGENVGTTADDTHLAACARCLADLEQLRAVVGGARGRETHDKVPMAMDAPPAGVWEAIADDLKLAPATRLAGRLPIEVVAASTDAAPNTLVVALKERRQNRSRRGAQQLAAAAMVGILVGGTGGWLAFGRTNSDDGTKVIASMTMPTLPSETGTATASLSQRADGTRLVMIVASALTPNPGGFYQVWLLDKSGTKAISLGPLGPDEHGQFQLPKDLDLAAFPVLDVSAELFNGNPAHSSHSIVRASLPV